MDIIVYVVVAEITEFHTTGVSGNFLIIKLFVGTVGVL